MSKIRDFINDNSLVMVACGYTNVGLCDVYLTTSGKVTREEYGFIEDCTDNEENESITLSLKTRSFYSVKRLQNYLIKLQS